MTHQNETSVTLGKRSSLARTRLSADQQADHDAKVSLTRVVSLRLTSADHAAYLAKVDASGMGRSAFFRECVLGNKTQILARPKRSMQADRLLYLINKASNNINQLAHRANADHLAGAINESTYACILSELQSLSQFMKATLKHAD